MTSTTTKAMRVGLYARVSTVDKGQDVGLQLDALRQEAAHRGWGIVEEFIDNGVSGAADSRPALDQLMDAVSRRAVDVVAVWKLDRLGRSLAHLIRLLETFQEHNVRFVSLGERGIDTTSPQGRLLLSIFGAFSEYERGLTRERVIAGVRRAQAQGKHCGRPKAQVEMTVVHALQKEGHTITNIARLMGVSRTTLRRRLAERVQAAG